MDSKDALKHTEDVLVLDEDITFSSMHLKPDLLRGFKDEGFIKPSPIQLQAIPRGKLGMDLICQSKSGTGKTLTFCTIILERINISNNNLSKQDLTPQAMIITPTREIAVQIRDVIRRIAKYYKYLTCDTFIGGVPLSFDKKNLNLGCQIIIGTPGRILQLININCLITFNVKIIVFDEADQLFYADSFKLDIRNILLNKTPKNKQILAFSASYNKENNIINDITSFMRNVEFILISNAKPTLVGVQQYFYFMEHNDVSMNPEENTNNVTNIAMDKLRYDHNLLSDKVDALLHILSCIPFNQCIVFINNKNRLKDICKILNETGFPSYNIGGDQPQTERLTAIRKLKEFEIRILVSSDLTSRGIDCDRINLVINLDLPFDAETYLHRVGRTGRFGTYGLAITFITKQGKKKEMDLLNNYMQCLSSKINELPQDLGAVVDEKYLNYSLELKSERDKKQFEQFKQKREKVLVEMNENKDKICGKLREPSNVIKSIYIEKEKEKALWNSAKNKKKKKKKNVSVDGNNDEYRQPQCEYGWQYQPTYGEPVQRNNDLMIHALKAAKCFHAMYG